MCKGQHTAAIVIAWIARIRSLLLTCSTKISDTIGLQKERHHIILIECHT